MAHYYPRPEFEMTTHAYTEDQLVEQCAIWFFEELGWQVAKG
jgi:hypothetical protein